MSETPTGFCFFGGTTYLSVTGPGDDGVSVFALDGNVPLLGDVLWQHSDGTVATGVRELGLAPTGFEIQGIGGKADLSRVDGLLHKAGVHACVPSTRESTMIKLITAPSAHFDDAAALHQHRDAAERYELAVRDYAATRDGPALRAALDQLGFDRLEIWWHADHPGQRIRQGFSVL